MFAVDVVVVDVADNVVVDAVAVDNMVVSEGVEVVSPVKMNSSYHHHPLPDPYENALRALVDVVVRNSVVQTTSVSKVKL